MNFKEYLQDSECTHSVGSLGPAVSARFRDASDMTGFHDSYVKYGFVPISVHWEERRVIFMPEEVLE